MKIKEKKKYTNLSAADTRILSKHPSITARWPVSNYTGRWQFVQSVITVNAQHGADAKMILMAPPPGNWRRPPGRPRIM